MKRRLIEKAAVPVPKHKNKKIVGKVQIEKEYLILDLFRKNTYIGRYVLDTETGEHAYVSELGHWHSYKLLRIMGYDPMYESLYSPRILGDFQWDTKEDEELAKKALLPEYADRNIMTTIQDMEEDYDKEKRMMDKVDETLAKVENAGGIYVGGTNLSTEATINDEEAEYPVLSKNASSISEITLFSKSLALKIGTYSVMIRMKVSDISKTDSVISVKIRKGSYTGEIIKEIRISPNMFDVNNKYKILGTVVDFGEVKKGTKMHIEASILKTTIMETVTIDYMLVNPAYTSVSAV